MTDRRRIAITIASALALALTILGYQVAPEGSGGFESQVWGFSFLAALGLALVGVFLVNRWWALLPSVSTAAASLLGAAIAPPSEPCCTESIPLSPEALIAAMLMLSAVFVTVLSLGLLARAVWDWLRRRRSEAAPGRGAR